MRNRSGSAGLAPDPTGAATVRREMAHGDRQPMQAMDTHSKPDQLGGLRRFAVAITIFTLLGHLWFGFEQSYAQPLVA